MSTETAALVANLIAAVLLVVWFAALWFTWNTSHPGGDHRAEDASAGGPDPADGAMPPMDDGGIVPGSAIVGSADVVGEPAEVVQQLEAGFRGPVAAAVLAGGIRVAPAGPDRLTMTGSGRGEIRLTRRESGRTRAEWWLVSVAANRLVIAAWVFVGLGLIAIVLARSLVADAIHAEDRATRMLAIQTIQAVHFVWPPFLFAGLARVRRNVIRNGIGLVLDSVRGR